MKNKVGSFLSLDKKLLAIVLVVNVVFTVVWTFTSLLFQQKAERENQSRDLQYIEAVILPAVSNSVWNVDQDQTRVQLQGVLVNPRVIRVRIQELGAGINDAPFIDINKSGSFSEIHEVTYTLKSPGEEQTPFARMTMYTTMDPIMARVRSEIIRYFVSEALETLILSFLILYAFRVLVLNHLGMISKFFKENVYISKRTPHFFLAQRGRFRDEIDVLAETVNRTLDESKKYQTQIEDLRDRAEKANQAKSMFLASINHELRTPLNAILGVTDLLPESVKNPEEMQQLLDIQKRSGLHLLHLVDEILDFSKIEAGEVKMDSQPMEIRKALETCKMIMEAPFRERGNRLELLVDSGFPEFVFGDPNRINQIIINLVSNANKFTDHGIVSVQIKSRGNEYEIVVKDTGRGIPEDKLEEIFIPFRQLEDKGGQMRKGTGIGLSITKRLVDIMGGRISVDSKVGLGSVFRITLPLQVPVQEPKMERVAEESQTERQNPKMKLLVVEDTPEVQMLIKAYLKGTNVDLTFAANGQEGVQKFEKDDPAVILMDLQMPVMNGYEATQKIRELENKTGHHHVRILALTALATKNDLDKALRSGCDGYMTKPFSRTKLLQILKDNSEAASAS
jgi:two-component system, sensor histidine kinase